MVYRCQIIFRCMALLATASAESCRRQQVLLQQGSIRSSATTNFQVSALGQTPEVADLALAANFSLLRQEGEKERQRGTGSSPAIRIDGADNVFWIPACCQLVLVTVAVQLFFTIFTFAAVSRVQGVGCEGDVARFIAVLQGFLLFVNYTVMIPDSLDLSLALGQSVTMSGLLVGLYQGGGLVGVTAVFALLRHRPTFWREGRAVLAVTSCGLLLASLVYIAVVGQVDLGVGRASLSALRLWWALLFLRVIGGASGGAAFMFVCVSVTHLTPLADRPAMNVRVFTMSLLGMGLGPALAAAMDPFIPCSRFTPVGLMQLVLATSLLLMAPLYPSLENELSQEDDGKKTQEEVLSPRFTAAETIRKQRVIVGCLLMSMIRSFMASGIEVATALLLEEAYHFQRHTMGFCIGVSFMSIIPVKLLHDSIHQLASTQMWITGFALASIACTPLLSHHICHLKGLGSSCGAVLVMGDTLLYPFIYMSDMLSLGIMQQHLFPWGSGFDVAHATFYQEILSFVTRCVGPIFARWCIAAGNQDMYAMIMSGASCFFFLIWNFVVNPVITQHEQLSKLDLQEHWPQAARAAQCTGEVVPATWLHRPASVGYCLQGLGVGGRRLLAAAGAGSCVLEVGPGEGEIVPSLLGAGCKVFVIGEGEHIKDILEKHMHAGSLDGVVGLFPQDMPESVQVDFVFAVRVVHCGIATHMEALVRSMFDQLRPGGKVFIDTTSPWSSYYAPFWEAFAVQDAANSCFQVSAEEMQRAGLANSAVTLLTTIQAKLLLQRVGFVDIQVTPYRTVREPCTSFGFLVMLALEGTKPS